MLPGSSLRSGGDGGGGVGGSGGGGSGGGGGVVVVVVVVVVPNKCLAYFWNPKKGAGQKAVIHFNFF